MRFPPHYVLMFATFLLICASIFISYKCWEWQAAAAAIKPKRRGLSAFLFSMGVASLGLIALLMAIFSNLYLIATHTI